jgi:hypothetical protein
MLEITPQRAEGTRLTVTADRLRITQADELTARVHGDDLRPWILGLEVESAEFHTKELATVVLRGKTLKLDRQYRQSERTTLGGYARLVAISCQDVVDGDVVEGSIVDISDSGVAILTRRLLRLGDRLTFSGRFFATVVQAEVRVARSAERGGQVHAGCTFIEISSADRARLREVTRPRPAATSASAGLLQSLHRDDPAVSESPGVWRRLLRRSA